MGFFFFFLQEHRGLLAFFKLSFKLLHALEFLFTVLSVFYEILSFNIKSLTFLRVKVTRFVLA